MPIFHNLATVVTLLIVLSVLVVAHEWGHFIVARIFKIRVDDFSIGFGPRLFRIGKLGDTEYNVRALPLGGFVKIAGMDADEEPINMAKEQIKKRINPNDPDSQELPLIAENTPEAAPYTDPDGFNNKPLWQRSLVILAGPVMSFVLGFLILCVMGATVGTPSGKILNKVLVVEPGGEGHDIGLRAGDRIVSIDGVPTPTGNLMVDKIHRSLGKQLVLQINRNGVIFTKTATPRVHPDDTTGKPVLSDEIMQPGGLSALGVLPGDEIEEVEDTPITEKADLTKALNANINKQVTIYVERNGDIKELKGIVPTNIATALPEVHEYTIGVLNFSPDFAIVHMRWKDSIKQGAGITLSVFKNLQHLIKIHKLHTQAGGIVKMYQMTGIAVTNGIQEIVSLAAQLSISLAIFNILPIPILDGGHLLSFLIEKIRRGKRLNEREQTAFMLTGLAIIAALFITINAHDIWQTIHGQVVQ